MPKATAHSQDGRQARRHNPLSEDYAPTSSPRQKAGKKRKLTQSEGKEDNFIDSRSSRRILKIGQELVDEDEAIRAKSQPDPAFEFASRFGEENESDEDEGRFEDEEDAWGSEEELEAAEVDPQDLDIFNRFHPDSGDNLPDLNRLMNPSATPAVEDEEQGTNLADLIMEKIAAHEALHGTSGSASGENAADFDEQPELPPKVVEVYTTVGQLLSRHRSGPLPKPFKILPSLPTDQIPPLVLLTAPENWTPHVHLQATRLFISAPPNTAQNFLHAILLPRVRADIHETKKLHVHLYSALKKALYKPACFFKGFLFPLLEGDDGAPTLREAQIISSVVARVSVPVLHSAAALLRLCDIAAQQFSIRDPGAGGPTNVFIRTLLEKKYALPYKVIDALVFHFLRFRALDGAAADGGDVFMTGDGAAAAATRAMSGMGSGKNTQAVVKELPLLWHQCLLVFAQRYRNDITEDQRDALLDLVLVRGHKGIGPEVRRELLEGRGRGVPEVEAGPGDGGDDTMMIE